MLSYFPFFKLANVIFCFFKIGLHSAVIIIKTLQDEYSHFTDEETKVQNIKLLIYSYWTAKFISPHFLKR
jgi:hypothetical protein